jgi:hypothetical protein
MTVPGFTATASCYRPATDRIAPAKTTSACEPLIQACRQDPHSDACAAAVQCLTSQPSSTRTRYLRAY